MSDLGVEVGRQVEDLDGVEWAPVTKAIMISSTAWT